MGQPCKCSMNDGYTEEIIIQKSKKAEIKDHKSIEKVWSNRMRLSETLDQ